MDSLIPMQLCVQGGAAKIALLAAVMNAVEALHGKEIRVTRVAGTSAGAIMGTLFAAGVPMSTVRQRLGAANLDRIIPERSKPSALLAAVRGKPLWNEDELRKLIASMLAESTVLQDKTKKLETFSDIRSHRGIETKVVATNLLDSQAVIRRDGDAIVSSLVDSAAIPLFFRSLHSTSATVVDGGLCENLPGNLLSDDPADGPIVAFSFRRGVGSAPDGMLKYLLAVISAGIDHSVDRTHDMLAQRAKQSNLPHQVFFLDAPFDSFDFKRAVSEGLGKLYEQFRNEAAGWLRDFVAQRRAQIMDELDQAKRVASQRSADESLAAYYRHQMPKNLAKLYAAQHKPISLRWSFAQIKVVVDAYPDGSDSLHHRAEFHTLSQPVWCHRLPVVVSQRQPVEVAPPWEVYGPDRQRISYYHMLMDDDGDPSTLEWLICFDNPLPAGTGPYRLELVEKVPNFFPSLRRGERDDLWVSFHRRQGDVDEVEVIAYVPKAMGEMELEPKSGAGHSEPINSFEFMMADYRPYGYRGTAIREDQWGMFITPSKKVAKIMIG